jgi:hypothetical protein
LEAEHCPLSAFTVTFGGTVSFGRSLSLTVTVKLQVLVLPAWSVAVEVTTVHPSENCEPEGGLEVTFTVPQPPEAVTWKLTVAEHWPGSVFWLTLQGQVMVGLEVVPFTVTVKVQVAVLPAASVAVEVTVVVPTTKLLPEAGVLVTTTPGQLSVAVTEKFTVAVHLP